MIRILAVLLSLIFISNAYAADKKSKHTENNAPTVQTAAPDPDELNKKAQQEAAQKTNYMNSKYKQHAKKASPDQTAAQTQAKHGGPTASNVAVPSQNSGYSSTEKTTKSNTKSKKNKN